MGNEFNKTEADFAYERYTKMGERSRSRIFRWKNCARSARLPNRAQAAAARIRKTDGRSNLHLPATNPSVPLPLISMA